MRKYCFIVCVLIGTIIKSYAQGCSDAGICYLANSKQENDSEYKSTIELGYSYGIGLEDVTYNNGFVNFTRLLSNKWSFASRVTYNQAHGSFGTLGQFGDVFLVSNYLVNSGAKSALSSSFGLKIPLSLGNLKINKMPLPMDYQASLGTVDALLGIDYKVNKWSIDAALQLPIVQSNRNSFFDEYSVSDKFPTTNLLRRKSDLLLRASYTLASKNNDWNLTPNLLGIYHLGNDTYEDIAGNRQTIEQSEGLTINASLLTEYKFNTRGKIQLNLATPLIVRVIRPDGLTRAFIASLSYQFQF